MIRLGQKTECKVPSGIHHQRNGHVAIFQPERIRGQIEHSLCRAQRRATEEQRKRARDNVGAKEADSTPQQHRNDPVAVRQRSPVVPETEKDRRGTAHRLAAHMRRQSPQVRAEPVRADQLGSSAGINDGHADRERVRSQHLRAHHRGAYQHPVASGRDRWGRPHDGGQESRSGLHRVGDGRRERGRRPGGDDTGLALRTVKADVAFLVTMPAHFRPRAAHRRRAILARRQQGLVLVGRQGDGGYGRRRSRDRIAVQAVEGGRELHNRGRRGRESGVSRRHLNDNLLLVAKPRVTEQEAAEVRRRQGNARTSAASDRRLEANDIRRHGAAAAAARVHRSRRPLYLERRRSVKRECEVV